MREQVDRREYEEDEDLHIRTNGIEEWQEGMIDYHRGEATSYRALGLLRETYQPLPEPFLVDYGSALGRINFYFHHYMNMPGIGLEVHEGRCHRAEANRKNYAHGRRVPFKAVDITFVQEKAEDYLPPPKANTFYFFHPFSDWIFRRTMEQILRSIDEYDRTVDLILYYPTFNYLYTVEASGYFEELFFLDCDWNDDVRDGFWVFRHYGPEDLG